MTRANAAPARRLQPDLRRSLPAIVRDRAHADTTSFDFLGCCDRGRDPGRRVRRHRVHHPQARWRGHRPDRRQLADQDDRRSVGGAGPRRRHLPPRGPDPDRGAAAGRRRSAVVAPRAGARHLGSMEGEAITCSRPPPPTSCRTWPTRICCPWSSSTRTPSWSCREPRWPAGPRSGAARDRQDPRDRHHRHGGRARARHPGPGAAPGRRRDRSRRAGRRQLPQRPDRGAAGGPSRQLRHGGDHARHRHRDQRADAGQIAKDTGGVYATPRRHRDRVGVQKELLRIRPWSHAT